MARLRGAALSRASRGSRSEECAEYLVPGIVVVAGGVPGTVLYIRWFHSHAKAGAVSLSSSSSSYLLLRFIVASIPATKHNEGEAALSPLSLLLYYLLIFFPATIVLQVYEERRLSRHGSKSTVR